MEILYLLVPISVVLVFVIGLAFWWSLRSGQFEDLDGPAHRILMDDDHSSRIGGNPASPARVVEGSGSSDKKDASV